VLRVDLFLKAGDFIVLVRDGLGVCLLEGVELLDQPRVFLHPGLALLVHLGEQLVDPLPSLIFDLLLLPFLLKEAADHLLDPAEPVTDLCHLARLAPAPQLVDEGSLLPLEDPDPLDHLVLPDLSLRHPLQQLVDLLL
jgi:hypothetical protein